MEVWSYNFKLINLTLLLRVLSINGLEHVLNNILLYL